MSNETVKRPVLGKKGAEENAQDSSDTKSAPETGAVEVKTETAAAVVETPPVVVDVPPVETTQAAAETAPAKETPPPVVAPTFAPPPPPATIPLPKHVDQGVGFDQAVAKMKEKGAHLVELVDVVAEKAYKLTLDNGVVVNFLKGVQSVHRFLAEHPYSIANGTKPYERAAGVAPSIPAAGLQYAVDEITAGRMERDYAIRNMANFYKVEESKVKEALDKVLPPK